MTTEHQITREQEVYERFLEDIREELSEPTHTVIEEAQSAAYAANMVHSYSFQPRECEEAMEKMRRAAAGLTEREHKLLVKLWRAALAAAASIDPEDFERLAGYRVYSGNLHWYYRMASGMVEETLHDKKVAELQKEHAEREPEDLSDIPF